MTDQLLARRDAAHHQLTTYEVVLLLETDPSRGLGAEEAKERLQRFGPNTLPRVESAGPLRRFLRQFHHPLIYVLLGSCAITAWLGEWVDTGVIAGVVVINAIVGFLQESKAEAALEALRAMVRTQARVIRDGHTREIASEDLVPGDLVRLEAGNRVPADLRLLRHAGLEADESALTGESLPVVKDENALPVDTPVADRRNMLYSGTLVTHGTGTAAVVATAGATELGEIHRLVGTADPLATPLTRKLAEFSKLLTVVILSLAAVTFAVGIGRGEKPGDMFTAAVALAVGAIPEGLPAAVTITLAIGVGRMARRKAVVRRLPAVETLGSTTVICTDKTGTLTENQMTVRQLWTPSSRGRFTGAGYAPAGELQDETGTRLEIGSDQALRWTVISGALCNDARLAVHDDGWHVVGDPTEGALLVAAGKAGEDPAAWRRRLPRVAAVPFSAERQLMVTWHRDAAAGTTVLLVKGAVERVVDLCRAELPAAGAPVPLQRATILEAADELAGQGMRVLAFAIRDVGRLAPDERDLETLLQEGDFVFTGLQAMLDPPRSSASAAIASCHTAGIDVKMITGDHAGTARAIAEQVGIAPSNGSVEVLTGTQLEVLDDAALAVAAEKAGVFARVTPEQKLRLVRALQSRRHVVAMTGDGVNDAPALRQADIGVAMGMAGTEVAKEAADMVLTDDEFATIEGAVEQGRGVFDNLTKFIVWTLPTNMGEGLVILVAILLGSVLPILPVQILWINMTTAVALGLMLAFEPKERDIMKRPPRDPRRPLLTGDLIVRTLLVSALLVAGSWWLFEWERSSGASLAEARTVAVNVFVATEALYLFACRSLDAPLWRVPLFGNRWLLVGVAVQALGQLALTYLPVFHTLFGTAALPLDAWAKVAIVAVAAALVVEADKRIRRRTRERRSLPRP